MKYSRRTILTAIGGFAAVGLTACGNSSSATGSAGEQVAAGDTQTLNLFTDSDVGVQDLWNNTLIPAFEKEHPNITLKLTAADDSTDTTQLAKLSASVKAGDEPAMDLIVDAQFMPNASQAGLLIDITEDNVPNLANVEDVMLGLDGELPYRGSAVVLAYDSTKVTDPPTTLDDLITWIKANPGEFTYNTPDSGGSGQGFVQAVLDKYLDDDTINTLATGYDEDAEAGWSQGFDELAGLTDSMYQKTYTNGNQASMDLLAQGEVSMVPVWSDMFLTAKNDGSMGDSMKAVSLDSPPMPGGAAYMGIPTNTLHQAAALELMNWVLEPEQQAEIVSGISGFPAISTDDLPDDVQDAFEDIDTTKEAPVYSAQSAADLNSQWSKLVP